jgi:hypothetical protein
MAALLRWKSFLPAFEAKRLETGSGQMLNNGFLFTAPKAISDFLIADFRFLQIYSTQPVTRNF